MGNKSSLMLQDEEIAAIQTETGCNQLIINLNLNLNYLKY
jgi:hypothetical protein